MAGREIYWNITNQYILYLFFLASLLIFVLGLIKRFSIWKKGLKENRPADIVRVARLAILQSRVVREKVPGLIHLLIFWGFMVLLAATVLISIEYYFGLTFLRGNFYLLFSLVTDLFGLALLSGMVLALLRRWIKKRQESTSEDYLILLLLLAIVITGFILEGLRLAAEHDPFALWSPAGFLFSLFWAGKSGAQLLFLHRTFWWVHALLSISFIAYIPYSKLLHMISAPLNQTFTDPASGKVLTDLDFNDESKESFGVGNIHEFTWKQLLDCDACMRCGRCQDSCPAYQTGKPLSPRSLTLDFKRLMGAKESHSSSLPEVIKEDILWSCTTCRACQEECPVDVEHIQKIIDLRRYQVLTRGEFPRELVSAYKNVESMGNPWGLGWDQRSRWAEDLGIPLEKPAGEGVILYWVGCYGSYDERNIKVTRAIASIMQQAGQPFFILGDQEKCCGDPVRRSGNEFLYQSLVMENIERLAQYQVKNIITQCPHCYNTLKNEYPKFGGHYEVFHHTEYLARLLKEGNIPGQKIEPHKAVYHDPCYLGRYNNIYESPRKVIAAAGIEDPEMVLNRDKSMCCGGGGSRVWQEERSGGRISALRISQALDVGAEYLLTSCPICLTMLSEEVKAAKNNADLKVLDIAELFSSQTFDGR